MTNENRSLGELETENPDGFENPRKISAAFEAGEHNEREGDELFNRLALHGDAACEYVWAAEAFERAHHEDAHPDASRRAKIARAKAAKAQAWRDNGPPAIDV